MARGRPARRRRRAQVAMDDGKVDKLGRPAGVPFGGGLIRQAAGAGRASSSRRATSPAPSTSRNGGRSASRRSRLCGCSSICRICWRRTSRSSWASRGPSKLDHRATWPACSRLGGRPILRRNVADFFLVGGADAKINPLSLARQAGFNQMARCFEPAEKACRPFDAKRSGMVIGEGQRRHRRGAGAYEEARGRRSWPRCSARAAFDRGRDGKGLARAIGRRLKQANVHVEQLDHVNAHGLSHPTIDAWEVRHPRGVRLRAGDGMGGQGALAVSAAAWRSWPPAFSPCSTATLRDAQLRNPDPACPVPVTRPSRPVKSPYFLKVGCTELGQCAAVVCKAWKE